MKLLITGGYGFAGSHLVRHIFTTYPTYKIWNLDLLTYAANPANLWDIEELEKELPPSARRYRFVQGDICDKLLIDTLIEEHKFDAIINLAAETHVDRSIHESKNFIKTNVLGIHTLLDAIRAHKVPRFVHISTDEVYGDRDGRDSAHEASEFTPSSPYSASKAAGDFLIQSYVRTFGIPAIIIRPSNFYGSHQYPEKLIPLAATNMLEGKKVPVHGDGTQIRSWLFVHDACHAIDVLLHRGHEGELYNIGGIEKKNIDVIHTVAEILQKDPTLHIEFTPDRPGQDKKYSLNWSKFQQAHEWKAEDHFDENMRKTVTWYLENPHWWQPLKQMSSYADHYSRQKQGRWF